MKENFHRKKKKTEERKQIDEKNREWKKTDAKNIEWKIKKKILKEMKKIKLKKTNERKLSERKIIKENLRK